MIKKLQLKIYDAKNMHLYPAGMKKIKLSYLLLFKANKLLTLKMSMNFMEREKYLDHEFFGLRLN